jgi:carbonic anhydrase
MSVDRALIAGIVALAASFGTAASMPRPDAHASHGDGSHGDPCAHAKPPHTPHWTYAGHEGPAAWGSLSPEWSACKTGTKQAPIDLPSVAPASGPAALAFAYQPIPVLLRNNGHTLQADNSTPAHLLVGAPPGERYELLQLHFHSPSEHTVDGAFFAMEMHLVHKNAAGALAVVGVLFKLGAENPALAALWQNAPAEPNKEPKRVEGPPLDLAALLPQKPAYHAYAGSLTTPPCTEGVSWYVLSPPLEVSEAQVFRFRELMHGPTNRPVQPRHERAVTRAAP